MLSLTALLNWTAPFVMCTLFTVTVSKAANLKEKIRKNEFNTEEQLDNAIADTNRIVIITVAKFVIGLIAGGFVGIFVVSPLIEYTTSKVLDLFAIKKLTLYTE